MKTNPVLWTALVSATLLIDCNLNAADLVWIGGTGNWNAAGNWSPAQIPTAADNVWITNSGTYTVTVPQGTTATNNSLTVGGTSGTQTLAVDRAPLSINGPSIINANGQLTLLVAQSLVTGPGSLAVNGLLNWPNGSISGAGALTINSGGTLAIGSGGITLGRTLNNNGSASWAGGNLTISANNSINNLTGGTLDITADGRLSGAASTPVNNSGLVRLTAGTTGTIITAPFNNNGTLQVLATTLNLNLGGTHSGVLSNAAGATLNLGGGAHSLSGSSFVTGTGTLNVSGSSTLAVSGNFDLGTALTASAGTVTLAAGCNVSGTTVTIAGTGGVILYNSAGSVGAVTVSAGTLGGTSPISVTGPLTLSGGTVTNALVTANGGLSINGNTTLNGTKLINPHTAVWSAGNFTGANGAAISNLVGGTFINTFDGNIATGAGATPLFINAGSFQKTNGTAAAGATSIDFQFFNTGTVEVRTNTLRYGPNQQTAGLTLLDGGGLSAQAQPLQLLGGSLVGTGLVTVANLQNVVNSSSLSPGLPIGELDITGNYQQTASGVLNIDIGGYIPASTFDFMTVSAGGGGGVATLAGTLNVSLANEFSPTNGASFAFLTASSRVGSFATFNYPSNDIGMQVSYDATSATIRVTNLKPVVANPLTDPAAITYGSAFNFQFPANTFSDPDGNTLTYSATGFPAGITFNSVTRTFSGTPTQAGSFPVSVTATDNGTPALSVSTGFTITISPATLTVSAQAQTKSYGAPDPTLTFTVSGLQLGDTAAAVLSGALSRTAGEDVAGSPYAISQGTLGANANYTLSFTGSSLSITPAPLSITADGKSKVYGAPDPAFTASFAGFVNGETPAVLSGTLVFARAPGENVGNYAITPSGLSSVNYAITFHQGTLSITRAALSVTADNKSKVYGAPDPAFTVSYSGFVNGDTAASLGGTLAFSRAPGENVGSYSLTPSGLTSGNYTLTFNAGTLSITRAALSVTADNKSKVYGAPDPTFTVTYTGFANGDTAAALGGTLAFTRAPGEAVGSYAVTPGGLTSSNYNIAFNAGALSITPAPLSVTADNKSKIYGAPDPVFTVSYSGFVNGDTTASLGGSLTFTRAPGENAGSYTVTPSGLTSSNYTIAFHSGTLSITAAPLSVTADNKSKAYGTPDPAFTVTYAGFVNGDTPAALGGTLTLTRVPGENVGSYAITPSGLTSSNYTLTFTPGALTISRVPLSITADGKTKIYGTIDPPFTVTYSGFVNGETPAVLGGALSITRATGENVGNYLITPSGLTSSNYNIAFNTGTLSITRAPLSVAADAKSKVYGAADPPFTATFAGFVNGETPAVLGGTLSFTRAPGENTGGYFITPAGLTSSNYSLTFNTGTLTITRATLTITAQAKTKTYGAADPPLTFTLTGLQFSDTQASVLTGALTRAPGETVAGSPYAISQGTLAANTNYSISFTGNTLSITPAPLSVAADNKSKVYGSPDPALTVTFAGFVNGETPAVLGGTLSISRTAGENVGSYTINASGLISINYALTFTTGTFSITRAALSVTADSKTKTFGTADPTFTVTYAGFVNGETPTILGGTLTITRASGENLGTYPITPAGLTSSNYNISFNTGTLTIVAPAPLILSLTRAGANISITWSAVSNATYRVQYKADLSGTNWTDLAGDVLANSTTASKLDGFTSTNRYYRIRLLP